MTSDRTIVEMTWLEVAAVVASKISDEHVAFIDQRRPTECTVYSRTELHHHAVKCQRSSWHSHNWSFCWLSSVFLHDCRMLRMLCIACIMSCDQATLLVQSFVRSCRSFVVISQAVKVRSSWTAWHLCQILLLTFQTSGSKFKVITAVLKIFEL